MRLRQVLVNLAGNAIKFTHEGEVVVDVSLQSHDEDRAMLHFRVIDTGIGIPADKQAMIFDAFEQADTSTTREYGGTGLGLAISRRLVGMMDGKLWVESDVGRGSTFHFTADIGIAPRAIREGDPPEDLLAGKRVLLVDGHVTNREIVSEILGLWKMDVGIASTAAGAISALEAAAAAQSPFALMIVDAQLPDASGFDLANSIAGHASLHETPIVALIAADRAAAAQADGARVSACLMKPAKHSEMHRALSAALGLVSAEVCPARSGRDGRETELPPLRILVGEDSLVNQKLIHEILIRRGHTVALAANGEEVLASLGKENFDIVLMDVQMPQMDGFETTRRIRRLAAPCRKIPIVAMTAHALPEDRERCLSAGMDDYVAKPIRVPALTAAMASALGSRSVFQPVAGPAATAVGNPVPEEGPIDWNQVLLELDGNENVLQILIEASLEEAPRLVEAIRAAVAEEDSSKLRLAAHTLKGAMRYFGETRAYQEAFFLEGRRARGRFYRGGRRFGPARRGGRSYSSRIARIFAGRGDGTGGTW